MKGFCIAIFLLIGSIVPCQAQTTTYSQEISVREKLAQRLGQQIKEWEQRKSMLEKTESDYQSCQAGKSAVDQQVEKMIDANGDSRRFRDRIRWERLYIDQANRMTRNLGITVLSGQHAVETYEDLERTISAFEKDRPERIRELKQLDTDLRKARADLDRAENEIAVLTSSRSTAAGKAAMEGQWLLPGPGGSNLIEVTYNEKDRHFYGTVTTSVDLICHPPGAVLFSVRPIPGSDTQFGGTEYGFDYDQAAGKCRPVQAKLTITVTGASMAYHNGSQRLAFSRLQAAPPPPLLPMGRRP